MLKHNDIPTREVETTEFTDSKSRRYTVKHSVIITENTRKELEEKIAEDLFLIFRKKK